MSNDIRLLISFRGHHKRKRLKRILGDGYLDHLIDLWLAVGMHRPDGILHGWTHEDIADYAEYDGNPDQFVQAMINCGWLDVYQRSDQITYKCHDWERHQPWLMGADARQEKARKAALTKHHGHEEATRIMQQASSGHAPSMQQGEPSMPDACAPSPSPSPSPKDTGDKPPADTSAKVPLCPHIEIVKLYHQHCPNLRRVVKMTKLRQQLLRARWAEDDARQDINWWEDFFKGISKSDFLNGRAGDRPFYADFEWLIRPNNFIKVIEGKYKNKSSTTSGAPAPKKVLTIPGGHTCGECGFFKRCHTPTKQNFCSASVTDSKFWLKKEEQADGKNSN